MTAPFWPVLLMLAPGTPGVSLNLLGEGATDLWLEGRADDNPDDPRPRERVAEIRTEVYVRVYVQPHSWLRATLSAFASAAADEERPIGNNRFFVANGTRERLFFDERLGEASIQLQSGFASIRIGKQYVLWGAAPVLSPNDVLGTIDFRRGPFPRSADPVGPRLPVWGVNPRADFGPLHVEGIWLPFFQPSRLSLMGDDFALFGAQATDEFGTAGLLQRIERDLPAYVQRRSNVLAEGAPSELRGGQAGARLLVRNGPWQFGAQYVYGFEPYPVLKLNTSLLDAVTHYYDKDPALRDPTRDFDTVIAALEAGQWFWSSRYRRMHHVGTRAEVALGDLHIGVEAAFVPRMTVYARSGRAADARVLASNLSAAYAPSEALAVSAGVAAAFPLLQGPPAELVFGWTRRAIACFVGMRLELPADFRVEGLVVTELDQYSVAGTAAFLWRRLSPLDLYVATDVFGGAPGTLGSRWTANDQVAIGGRLRY